MTRIAVDGIDVAFGKVRALDGVSLTVPHGAVTAVVGGDGAGKSTLLRVFAHRVRPSAGHVSSPDRKDIGLQPAMSGVWANLSVAENIQFVGRSYGMSSARIRERGDDLLEHAELTEARDRLGRDLSGGMRQKLGFLLAILHEPELVLLDEPSTGVDPVSRVELWRLISATAVADAAVLIATTYLDEAQRATSVLALEGGRVLADGVPEQIIRDLPGRIGLLPADAGDRPDAWRRGIRRHVWIPEGAAAGDATLIERPDLEDVLIAHTLAQNGVADAAGSADAATDAAPPAVATPRDGHAPSHRAEPVIASGRGLTRRFGHTVAVDDVTIEVRAGEIVGLIGANGAGKTTFLRMLIGLDRPDEGTVELFGAPPDNAARRRLGYVPQGLGLYRTISVDENVEFISRVYRSPEAQLPPSLRAVEKRPVAQIGLGRQRQLAFALALSHDPELLVLDEPTSGVDPLSRARLWDIIHEQAASGRGVIVTTHYLQEAEQCSRLALLARGRLFASGLVDDLIVGMTAVLVRADAWQEALDLLGAAGLPTMLTGRDIRVAGSDPGTVAEALAAGGVRASVQPVPPTLEETVVLLEREPAPVGT